MLERGDLIALHEPFCNLDDFGETDVEGRTFDSPVSLLSWLRDQTRDIGVFLKDTTDRRHHDVLADRRFLAEARHAFLIRRPEEIAASMYALLPDMRGDYIGLEALYELHAAVRGAGGHDPVVIDSDDLVTRPEATMAAYCAAVELPFLPQALTWEPGDRLEWRRSARWHADASASSGFEQREGRYAHTVETSDELARFAAHHLPYYEQLHARRLDVAAWEPTGGLLTRPLNHDAKLTTDSLRQTCPRVVPNKAGIRCAYAVRAQSRDAPGPQPGHDLRGDGAPRSLGRRLRQQCDPSRPSCSRAAAGRFPGSPWESWLADGSQSVGCPVDVLLFGARRSSSGRLRVYTVVHCTSFTAQCAATTASCGRSGRGRGWRRCARLSRRWDRGQRGHRAQDLPRIASPWHSTT